MAKILDQVKAKMGSSRSSANENESEGFVVNDHKQRSTFKKQTVCTPWLFVSCQSLTNPAIQGKDLEDNDVDIKIECCGVLQRRCTHHH
jgi:hypothetical protein